MSLHALAGHMATKGRGGDSMLVHMTPEEVQSLQALALKDGGSLTINPDTGLPEANFLKKMLPMIAGFALGPAGFGLMSAGMAGAAVGGITALSTGSLSRGLMAGLGAYGGASLGSSLMGASAGTPAANAAALGVEGAATGVGSQAAMLAEQTAGFGAEGLSSLADSARVAAGAVPSKAGMLSAGFDAVTKSPEAFGNFAKNNWQAGLAAISPMMADEGVQTTTKRPDTGYIRNYSFDPYTQRYTDIGSYPASEYKGMAQGGIVALAAGGNVFNEDAYLKSKLAQMQANPSSRLEDYTGSATDTNYLRNYMADRGLTPQAHYQQYGINENVSPSSSGATFNENIYLRNKLEQLQANPTALPEDYQGSFSDANYLQDYMSARGLTPQAHYQQYGVKEGVSPYSATDLVPDFDKTVYMQNKLAQMRNTPSAILPEYQGPLNDPFYLESFMASRGLTPEQHYARYGAAEGVTPYSVAAMTSPVGTRNPYGNAQNPGDKTFNADGSITAQANIPGRPYGGFTGMGQLRDAYTQGGGSLGYTNPAFEDFEQQFNKQTGDSLAAYEYLMGQGAYPTKSGVEQIMRPYNEVTLGMPVQEGRPTQQFIFENGQYRENPNYVPVSYNSKGERVVGTSQTDALKGFDALAPAQTRENFDYEAYRKANPGIQIELAQGIANFGNKNDPDAAAYNHYLRYGIGEGQKFPMIADAKPADDAVFEWADTNNVSDAQLAPLMGLSVAEVAARRAKYKKPEVTAVSSNSFDVGGYGGVDVGGYGGSNTASNNASVESMGSDTGFGGDGANAGAPGGGSADGGPGSSGDGGTGDSGTAVKRGGLVPRRMALGGLGSLAKGGVAELPDGAFVVPARITSELGNGSTNAGAQKLFAMEQRLLGKNAQPVNLGRYSGGGNLVRGAGDGVSDSVPATIGGRQPARIADGESIVSREGVEKLGDGSIEAGARKLYAMMDRVQKARGKTTGKNRVAANTRADKYLPA